MTTRKKKSPPEEGGQILSLNSLRFGAQHVLEINQCLLNKQPIEVGKYPDFQDVIDQALKYRFAEDASAYFLKNIDPEIRELAFDPEKETRDYSDDDDTDDDDDSFRPNKSQMFIEVLQLAGLELLRDPKKVPYMRWGGELFCLDKQEALDKITELALDHNAGVSKSFLTEVANTLSAIARVSKETPIHSVYKRYAPINPKNPFDGLLIDIGDESRDYIRIDKDGWHIEEASDDLFINRPEITVPMVRPEPDEDFKIEDLREVINTKNMNDLRLVLSWAIASMWTEKPYPLLSLIGQAGSGKTELIKKLKQIIDPSEIEVRTEPRETRDLVTATRNASVLVYDNLSKIDSSMSDILCVLSTGGSYAARELNTTADERAFNTQAPVAFTSVAAITERPDLMSRVIDIWLPRLKRSDRKAESWLNPRFEELKPAVMALFCDCLVLICRDAESVEIDQKYSTRMLDWQKRIGSFADLLGWTNDEAQAYYGDNVDTADDLTLENHVLTDPLLSLIKEHGYEWEGSMTDLHNALDNKQAATPWVTSNKDWPRSVQELRKAIAYLAPPLERVHGLIWEHGDKIRKKDKRINRFHIQDDIDDGDDSNPVIVRGGTDAISKPD